MADEVPRASVRGASSALRRAVVAAMHLILWVAVLRGWWLVWVVMAVGWWCAREPNTRQQLARGLMVQGCLAAGTQGLRAILPPVGPWLMPVPWIDVVRVSGTWLPHESGFVGGWVWAAVTTMGACMVTPVLMVGLVSGPWLAWTAWWGSSEPEWSTWKRQMQRVRRTLFVGLMGWMLATLAALIVSEPLARDVLRGVSWGWLLWCWWLLAISATLPLAVLRGLGWVWWPGWAARESDVRNAF